MRLLAAAGCVADGVVRVVGEVGPESLAEVVGRPGARVAGPVVGEGLLVELVHPFGWDLARVGESVLGGDRVSLPVGAAVGVVGRVLVACVEGRSGRRTARKSTAASSRGTRSGWGSGRRARGSSAGRGRRGHDSSRSWGAVSGSGSASSAGRQVRGGRRGLVGEHGDAEDQCVGDVDPGQACRRGGVRRWRWRGCRAGPALVVAGFVDGGDERGPGGGLLQVVGLALADEFGQVVTPGGSEQVRGVLVGGECDWPEVGNQSPPQRGGRLLVGERSCCGSGGEGWEWCERLCDVVGHWKAGAFESGESLAQGVIHGSARTVSGNGWYQLR